VICLAVALVGCGSAPRVARYRFTVEVDDNGGIVSGSSVQEEHCTFNDGFFKQIGNALNCGVKGEAVVVDLGAKGQLFVLLTQDKTRPRASGNARGIFEAAHFDLFVNRSMTAAVFDRVAAYKEPVTARAVNMHLMVRFLNVDDPRSAKPVDPEHLDASFGPGVKLEKATVLMTNDAPTIGIEKRLPWLIAPHTLAGIVHYQGDKTSVATIPALPELLYDDFWSFME
jgi:hypothetical protein